MKTKDRVLLTGLTLFNEEGESNVTAVDIADEMDISPGNLYYHFKGKDPIIKMLFENFESDFIALVSTQSDQDFDLEQSWSFLLMLFERIHNFRFFYLNLQSILRRLPELKRRFQKLLELHQATTKLLILSLIEKGVLTTGKSEVDILAEQMVITVTYWLPFSDVTNRASDPVLLYHKGVFQVISLIAPHLHEDHRDVYTKALQILNRALHN